MKIAICKIGANITFSAGNKSAANADILYALRTLDVKRHDITIVTHKTRNTLIPPVIKFQEVQAIKTFDEYDVILLFNGSINFFGGAEDPNVLQLYRAMSNSSTPIAYVQTDGQLQFRQMWPSIMKREWAQGYKESDFHIDGRRVVYVTQGRDLTRVLGSTKLKPDFIQPHDIIHFSWERTILAKRHKYFSKPVIPMEDRHYDIGYGGATRNAYRRKRIEHYYNAPNINSLLFGNLRGVTAPNAEFHHKTSYQDFIRKMQTVRSTVIVCDQFYEDNFFTLRMYESILAGCVVFIDKRMDPAFNFYGMGGCKSFYVSSATILWDWLEDASSIDMTRRARRGYELAVLSYNYQNESDVLSSILEYVSNG